MFIEWRRVAFQRASCMDSWNMVLVLEAAPIFGSGIHVRGTISQHTLTSTAGRGNLASERLTWRLVVKSGVRRAEENRRVKRAFKQQKRKASISPPVSVFICDTCTKDCHSRIGLYGHRRSCSSI
ncbi:hypothetical protein HOLleu_02261 [Holothuria leucospilota]|uniref:Uncharacterized protein n=1 Tax=Holothuria leucospilota TaxID=206669 RepID=A0A9Q1CQ31_HOLLE|nr:hypothetical protein HOLleu_02261 [Holothuria leucospilota]